MRSSDEKERTTMKLVRWMIVIVLALIAAPFVFLYVMQDRLLYPGAQAVDAFGNLMITRPDVTLRGWVLHPDANDALIVFGGNGMSLSRFATRLGRCSDRAIYLMPYRGYEGQAGASREHDMVGDGIALMDEAQKKHANVAILGISLGTGIATQVAAARHPQRLVLVTPYDSMANVGSDTFGGLSLGWLMHDHYDSAAAAARLDTVPVYVLQASKDEVIGSARTEALVRSLPQPPVRWDHVATGHNTILRTDEFCEALRF
jgi:pimeloyl-ACP methyl ester carboxylesterase